MLSSRKDQSSEKRYISLSSKAVKLQKFDFKTYELAFTVREILYEKIIKFDKNADMQFQETQIREFLINILLEKQGQIHYFIKNVFRYDNNNDGIIEYDELVNFCMEQHLGQIAIQRLHRQKLYLKGAQRFMNEGQFIKTINYALSFLQFKPNSLHLQILFKSVDIDGDGDISYEDYFRFLKEYFGSKSYASKLVNTASIKQEIKHSKQNPTEKKELDIVRKYSKYQNLKNDNNKPNQSIRNNPKNTDSNLKNSSNNSNMKGSNISSHASNLQSSGINNSASQVNKATDPFANNESSDTKRRPSFSQGIAVTIGSKQSNKSKEINFSQQQAAIANKIARLILSQLKLITISLDTNKTLKVTSQEIIKHLKVNLHFSENILQAIMKKGTLGKQKRFSYEQGSKLVILQYVSKIFLQANINDWSKVVSLQEFAAMFENICSIVPNTPLASKFQDLYKLRSLKGTIDFNEFYSIVCYTFNHYNFAY